MADIADWDLDERGIPTFVAGQRFAILTVPGADGGILRIEYASNEENALAGKFESIQVYVFKDQAEALANDLTTLSDMPVGRRQGA